MNVQSQHYLRLTFKAALLVCLPLTGFLWAMPSSGSVLAAAAVLTVISIAVGIGAEFLATSTEINLKELSNSLAGDRARRAEELTARDEKLRQFDRVVHLLTEQNHALRARLLAAHNDLVKKVEDVAAGASDELVPQHRSAFASRGL